MFRFRVAEDGDYSKSMLSISGSRRRENKNDFPNLFKSDSEGSFDGFYDSFLTQVTCQKFIRYFLKLAKLTEKNYLESFFAENRRKAIKFQNKGFI